MKNKINVGPLEECARLKFWGEVDDSEKIERMREQVKMLQEQFSEIEAASDRFRQHQHSKDGVILVPLSQVFHCRGKQSRNDKECYF